MIDLKKMKAKIKTVPAIIVGVVTIAVVASVTVYAVNKGKDTKETPVGISVEQKKLTNSTDTTPTSTAVTTVEIQFENSAILTGTQLKVTALVTPADTDKALIWSSSNEDVFTVDADGVVSVKGTGTSVLTATVGTVSDAVVIEGIDSIASGSKNGFPVYTGATASGTPGTSAGSSGSSGSTIGTGSSGSTGSSKSTGSSSGDSSSATSENTGNSGGNSSTGNSSNDGGSSDNQNSTSPASTGASSSQVASDLSGMGFSQIMSNVYQCEEGGTYYGEIIVQPNVTIIYIKLRSGAFDSKIQSVISELLPGQVDQVWSNYLSAASDRTFTADGRKVRIVVAANGGHSQIVIYN